MGLGQLLRSRKAQWVLAAVAFLCLFAWQDLFHDLPRKQLLADSWRTDVSAFAHFFITFHCPAQPIGLALGSAAYLFLPRLRPKGCVTVPRTAALLAMLLVLNVLHLLFVDCAVYGFADLAHVLANAMLAYLLIVLAAPLFAHGVRAVALFALSLAGGRILASLVVVPLVFQTDSFLAGGAIQCLLLLVGMGCALVLVAVGNGDCDQAKDRRTDVSKTESRPVGLVMHLTMFGFVLAFFHTVGRRVVYGETLYTSAAVAMAEQGSLLSGMASLFAALIVLVWFLRGQHRFSSVWNMLRTVVFALAMLELLLLPLLSASGVAVVLGDCASALYLMLFPLGCYFVYEESSYTASSLMGWALFLLCGCQALSSLALEYGIRVVLADSELFAVLRVVAFLMCTAAIFWVGSDNQVRKLWGLRREQTPQQYKDSVVRQKCDVLADEYGLSQREHEVLVLVAQGMRVSQVAEMLYVSQNTVRSHIQRIYGKLAIHSYKELAALVKEAPINR